VHDCLFLLGDRSLGCGGGAGDVAAQSNLKADHRTEPLPIRFRVKQLNNANRLLVALMHLLAASWRYVIDTLLQSFQRKELGPPSSSWRHLGLPYLPLPHAWRQREFVGAASVELPILFLHFVDFDFEAGAVHAASVG